ncbi:unnamed protein product [Rotaria sp. Silwood2]|nr:unnamed protein product [Rotaria sp. Silwood2]CAF2879200.1 unnamed protein product [Rotaria sp. Silwood2]CAF2901584.1 unnamed protein product [Rotaria sp. Silwood2]CAF4494522.1 unnamed protein product [Rotaria sp. Silwood2]
MSSSTSSRYRESAAVTAPTKVHDQHSTSFAEEHALDAIAKEAELRLQNQREQNREARQLRHKELEKKARDDDGGDSTSTPVTPSTPMSSSRSRIMNIDGTNNNAMGATTNSLLLQKFLNGDTDLRSIEQRDLRRLLSELETKYKTSMIANSSMYNEKQALRYQVDTFKDILDEHYETLNQAKRQLKEKSKDFDLQKRTLTELQREHNQLKEILAHREKLIQESGMQLLIGDEVVRNNSEEKLSSVFPTGIVSQETLALLNSLGKGSIDEKLKRILNEKREQFEQIVKLKSELDEEKTRLRTLEKQIPKFNDTNQNVNSQTDSEQQKQLTKEITDLKNRLQRLEADNLSLQQENKRYDAQLKRHKQQTDDAERVEEDLKQERRRLQREYRDMKSRYDDLLLENQRLQDRIDSMEFVRRNYNSSSRQHINSSASGTNSYLPPTPSNRSARGPSVSRFTSVEREMDLPIPPPYRSREPSVARRNSRDYSNDRWSTRRDSSSMSQYGDNEYTTSNKRRPDRWSAANSPKTSSPNYNFSSLPGRIYLHLRVAREDLENERTRSDVLQRENERLRTLRKKTLLNNTEDNLVVSAIVSRSHTNSPLPPAISSSSSSSISTSYDLQLNPSIHDPT